MVDSLENINAVLKNNYTVFFASSSYEDRCLTITKEIISRITFDYKWISVSLPHKEIIGANYLFFVEKLGFTSIEINNRDQIETVTNIIIKVAEVIDSNGEASFLIDISTFTKQTLLILLRVLRNLLTTKNTVQFVYTPAKEYAVGLPEEQKWLTKGILEVNSVFGFSGIIRPSRPYHLIILMGYEVERASSLINEYEPTKISIGYAEKMNSIEDEHYNLNKKRFDQLFSEFPFAEQFEFSCVDIEACKYEVLKQVEKYPGYNIIISPMNNKISTISTALAAFENEELQIAIAIPAIYNTDGYSVPGDKFYLFDIPNFIKE